MVGLVRYFQELIPREPEGVRSHAGEELDVVRSTETWAITIESCLTHRLVIDRDSLRDWLRGEEIRISPIAILKDAHTGPQKLQHVVVSRANLRRQSSHQNLIA